MYHPGERGGTAQGLRRCHALQDVVAQTLAAEYEGKHRQGDSNQDCDDAYAP